jgi:hypothetical protein
MPLLPVRSTKALEPLTGKAKWQAPSDIPLFLVCCQRLAGLS